MAPNNYTSYAIYRSLFAYKTEFLLVFNAGLEHMAAWSRGNGTNFNWLKKSCDISTCDWSPGGNPEKYGGPMKSAIS